MPALDYEFVPEQTLAEFTGYDQPSRQCATLSKNGIFFIKGRDGKPKLTWYHLNHPNTNTQVATAANDEPNFSAI